MIYIDLHCDTLYLAALKQRPTIFHMDSMSDLKKLRQGGAGAQFFAVFMPEKEEFSTYPHLKDDDHYIRTAVDILQNTIRMCPDDLALATGPEDLHTCLTQNKIAAFLTLEDGRAIRGSFERLNDFYQTGFRLISLTWNHENCFGFPNSTDPSAMSKALTSFGRDAVKYMAELGILVDVSHLSDGGFWDVADILSTPFVASHSNCRALCPHPRNLTDEMLRCLADHGGVAGLNFCPAFLAGTEQSAIAAMLTHLRHMMRTGGIDCVALGTDFDGIHGELEISGAHQMPNLFRAMEQDGFTSNEIEKIAWKNAARVIKDVIK